MKNTKSLLSTLLLSTFVAGSALVSSGCDDPGDEGSNPLVGTWESEDRLSCNGIGSYNDYNQLLIGGNLMGEATLHFASWFGDDIECSYADFDVRAYELGDGAYRIELDCQDENALGFSCADLDTNIDCRIFGNDLSCESDGAWEDYDLDFERAF